jgi:hypothetical protein
MTRRSKHVRRCSGLAIAVLVAATLAGAGGGQSAAVASSATSPGDAGRTASLCKAVPHVDSLVVTRISTDTHFGYTFPAVVSVTRAAQARRVARAACALPPINRGVLACTVQYGASYQLTFGGRSGTGETIGFTPTGCETLTGLDSIRAIGPRQGFYRTLGSAMGLRDASRYTFIGAVIDPPSP